MAIELPRSRVRAPELSGGEGWLNTGRPLALAGLRGKVVILDFWTYCCINCMHVLPDLKRLERKHRDTLVVIGVHSAKFTNEGESAHIREAIARYEIEHPVVNDRRFAIWQAYAVRAWPTLIVIDPAGYVVGTVAGEGHGALLDEIVQTLIDEGRASGTLAPRPGPVAPATELPASLLHYPGKIVVDEPSGRVFIADSNHNRIVVAAVDGQITRVIGTGHAGADDGDLGRATLNHPQGMAVDEDVLYVADTDNHLVRAVDLERGVVETLAGTGEQGRGAGSEAGAARTTSLNSPWDLALADGRLFIAMAGLHQVWVLDPGTREIGPYAGTGREAREDGVRGEAALAQPSGITGDDRYLYVADSETSSIRAIDRRSDRVDTIVGRDLFEFGDVDGVGDEVRLQHPLGVTAWKGLLYVADTYNHKVKVIDPVTRRCSTLAGTGEADVFFEPGGLSVGLGWLWVADTNHHAVQVVDLTTGASRALPLSPL
ncbi:MAG TPA: thioredoxin-like domain-containing protein [Methylomirabilota bacterium]|jgi:thiol-disulfide isomerase/thioredoxin|nr:thioredoxin-like domain-containing protein [Methylomirabilota bacterium]